MDVETIEKLTKRGVVVPKQWESEDYVLVEDKGMPGLLAKVCNLAQQGKHAIVILDEKAISGRNCMTTEAIERMHLTHLARHLNAIIVSERSV